MTGMKKRKSGDRARGAKGERGARKGRGAGVGAGGKRGAAQGKRAAAPKSVDEYLARVAEPGRGILSEMRDAIRSVVPAEAVEIISYRIPAFRHGKVLVWYAAFAQHCSLFPMAAMIEEFRDDLKGYKTAKGTIQFPFREPLPVDLIKRIVKARVVAAAGRGK
ncbi:MAG: DUF1801 domain-containing protein [Candidatus Acidiferrales bacterium]